jgi:hypothetical protein
VTRFKQPLLTLGLIGLSLTFCLAAFASAKSQKNQSPPPPPNTNVDAEPDWERFELDGGAGDRISVLLPQKPTDFGVAKLRRPSGAPLPTRVYMLSTDAKVYVVLFVDLPQSAAKMTGDERGELFDGSWRGVAARTSQALEEKFGSPFPITASEQKVGEIQGGERRMQDFKIGTQNGRAQAMFVGQRAYMLVAVWDARPESEADALRFLNSFQVHREHK